LALLLASGLLATGSWAALRAPRVESIPRPAAASAWDEARAAYADRDLPRAESILRALLRSQPDRREARLLLGRTLCERGRSSEARGIFSALEKEQGDPESVRGLGAVSESERQFDLAASFYRRAAELRKDDPSLWRDLARAQAGRGDALGALGSLQESLRLDPGQTDLLALQSELAAAAQTPQRRLPAGLRPAERSGRAVEAAFPVGPPVPDPSRAFPRPDGRPR